MPSSPIVRYEIERCNSFVSETKPNLYIVNAGYSLVEFSQGSLPRFIFFHTVIAKCSTIFFCNQDDGGWTPIMWAAEDKQYDATQLLIEQGANVHIRDEVRLLLKRGEVFST